MRNYAGRLARLEAALKPEQDITIRVVYVDGDQWREEGKHVKLAWGDERTDRVDYRRGLHHIAPVATVAPGLLDKLMPDDTAVTAPPAAVSSPPGSMAGQPAGDALPPGEQAQPEPWNFQQAREQFRWEQAQMERAERHRERQARR